jgi:hypothetical protein
MAQSQETFAPFIYFFRGLIEYLTLPYSSIPLKTFCGHKLFCSKAEISCFYKLLDIVLFYQIVILSFFGKNILSPGFTLNAL